MPKQVPFVGLLVCVSWCLAVPGCDDDYHEGPRFWGDRVSPRNRWVASGTVRNAAMSVDGNLSTAAVAAPGEANPHVTVDLGKDCLFNMIAVEHGPDERGFARRVAISTSYDGVIFTPQLEVPGLRKVTTAILIKPVLARYVRLQVVIPGDRPWSVAEIHLN